MRYASARVRSTFERRAFMVYVGDIMSGMLGAPEDCRFSSVIDYFPPPEDIDVEATIDHIARVAALEVEE